MIPAIIGSVAPPALGDATWNRVKAASFIVRIRSVSVALVFTRPTNRMP